MKRFLTLLAFVALTITANAVIQSGSCGDNVTFVLNDDGTLVISGSGEMTSFSSSATIPWYGNRSKITQVQIEAGVTNIGGYAFYYCSGLKTVTIPNSVTIIENYAFRNCSNLTSVTIPNSVTSIGINTFSNCSGLTSVSIPNSVTSIGNFAFEGCSKLTSITIPTSVTSIGIDAFKNTGWYENQRDDSNLYLNNCLLGYKGTKPSGSLNTISSSTRIIADGAFQDCTGLTSVTIPSSVTSIGTSTFEGCSGLATITVYTNNSKYDSYRSNVIVDKSTNTLILGCKNSTIPNTVTSIGKKAFYKCSGLKSIAIPNSVTDIGDWAFLKCTGLTSVTIGNSVTSIGEYAFRECSGLASVTIPNSVASIGKGAFLTCSGLPSVSIPNSVIEIGYQAFNGCSGLTSVTIGNSVTSIDDYAFGKCSNVKELIYAEGTKTVLSTGLTSITSVTIPNSATRIENNAFGGCSDLTSITIPNSVMSIGQKAFYACSGLTSVTIPGSVTSIEEDAFSRCSKVKELVYAEGCSSILSTGLTYITSVSIPKTATKIDNRAFENCSGLTYVTIPNSVTIIGDNAFAGCTGIQSVDMSNSVISIGNNAFSGCRLPKIELPNTLKNIGNRSFQSCWFTSVTIPNSVVSIGEDAFAFCNGLQSLTIGSSLTNIGNGAFMNCSNLRELICLASEVPTLGSSVFYRVTLSDRVLYVPNKSLEAYKAANQWKDWPTIIGIKETLNITDGEAYTNNEEKTYDELTFTKTFSSSVVNKWNALYVPMSINIEDYLDVFDFAEIFNISPTEDTNGDGEIDGRDANKLIVNKLKTGTTDPNKPYLIRPKNAGTYTFASADNVLYPAEEKSYSCSTMTDEYTFTGLYASQGVTGNDKYYMTINGILDFSPTKTITVKPNRWIMTVKSRNGSTSPANAKAISLSVIGEDEGTTAIEHVDTVRNDGNIYNLNGVKMDSKNLPAGIYVKNGKKVLVK